MRGNRFACVVYLLIFGVGCPAWGSAADEIWYEDWRPQWIADDGFSIRVDTHGYDFPGAIAMVPNPGPGPKDPLYFVTELRGKLKVVTNDRSVFTFAEGFFRLVPPRELPNPYGEMGMAAVTLEPINGWVFVSFVYQDDNGILRNNIVRFDSAPRVFGLKAKGMKSFDTMFRAEMATTHQIGGMVVQDDQLFVGVGDGFQTTSSQMPQSILGKILRMSLDGQPLIDNPFYLDDDAAKPQNFVWAIGMRQPFGLALANGRLFTAENGLNVDRFLEVHRGQNYGWDGTDWSIGKDAPMVFGPSVAPVQMAWMPKDSSIFPEGYRSKFYVALMGGQAGVPGIATLDYDFEMSRLADRPRQFLRYVGEPGLVPVGVSFGKDALYVAVLNHRGPIAGVKGAVLRVSYDPRAAENEVSSELEHPEAMMLRLACTHCHSENTGEIIIGPPLDAETLIPRILDQLNSLSYQRSLAEIDALDTEPFKSYRDERLRMMSLRSRERARVWIKNRLLEPMFDRRTASMPNLGLSEVEAQKIADYFVSRDLEYQGFIGEGMRILDKFTPILEKSIPILSKLTPQSPRRRHVARAFGLGIGLGICSAGLLYLLVLGSRRAISRWRRARTA